MPSPTRPRHTLSAKRSNAVRSQRTKGGEVWYTQLTAGRCQSAGSSMYAKWFAVDKFSASATADHDTSVWSQITFHWKEHNHMWAPQRHTSHSTTVFRCFMPSTLDFYSIPVWSAATAIRSHKQRSSGAWGRSLRNTEKRVQGPLMAIGIKMTVERTYITMLVVFVTVSDGRCLLTIVFCV